MSWQQHTDHASPPTGAEREPGIPATLDWIDGSTADALSRLRTIVTAVRNGEPFPQLPLRSATTSISLHDSPPIVHPPATEAAPTTAQPLTFAHAAPDPVVAAPQPDPGPVMATFASGVAESPEQWLSRMWGETGEYALDPEQIESSLREAETRYVIEQNRTSLPVRLAQAAITHPRKMLAAWFAFVAVLVAAGTMTGTEFARDYQLTSGESRIASYMLADGNFLPPANENILVTTEDGSSITSMRSLDAINAIVKDVRGNARVEEVGIQDASGTTPSHVGADVLAPFVSQDRRSAVIPVTLRGKSSEAYKHVDDLLGDVRSLDRRLTGHRVEMIGDATAKRATIKTSEKVSELSEYATVPIIVIVLLLVLGSLRAALVPVVLAVTSVAAATGASAVASHALPASVLTSAVITLIGMAVGTDYTFFVLRRAREEYHLGRSFHDSLLVAASTSGRAIVVSGITVIVGLSGMFLSDTLDFKSIAIGSVLVVGISVLGAIFALPAVLTLLGERVARTPESRVLKRLSRNDTMRMRRTPWTIIARGVLRRPGMSIALTVAALVLLSSPVPHMKRLMPGFLDVNWPSAHEVDAYRHIQHRFPGEVIPAVVVARVAQNVDQSRIDAAIAQLDRRAQASPLMAPNTEVEFKRSEGLLRIMVPLEGNGTDRKSVTAIRELREDILPATIGTLTQTPSTDIAVTGTTVEYHDFAEVMRQRTPWVFTYVILVSFVVLLLSFRSIVVPIKATILNLLSVGATYGALTLVFQHGWGNELIGAKINDSVVAWLPLFLYVVMFGLAMDYHVFILSRVRELWLSGEDPDRAVVLGIGSTARTVSASAIVMIGVFAVFMGMPVLDMKQMGFGLTIAVVIDAWVVRGILLPASMKLLGARNWYLPGWLSWLPELSGHGVSAHVRAKAVIPEDVPLALALDMGRISTPTPPAVEDMFDLESRRHQLESPSLNTHDEVDELTEWNLQRAA